MMTLLAYNVLEAFLELLRRGGSIGSRTLGVLREVTRSASAEIDANSHWAVFLAWLVFTESRSSLIWPTAWADNIACPSNT
jgi:hypothetical protein